MKVSLLAGCAAAAALMAGGQTQAAIIVFDDFNGYNPTQHSDGKYDLDFHGFNDLTVEEGSVDLIGTPNAWNLTGNNAYVDLDGTTSPPNGGTLRTQSFAFNSGDAIVMQIRVAGNQRGGSDQWEFGFQSDNVFGYVTVQTSGSMNILPSLSGAGTKLSGGQTARPANADWQYYPLSFIATTAGSMSAYISTASQDNVGPLVDDLIVTRTPTPEPGVWALMIAGFGMTGSALRRRRAATV
jgi:hypothetical protein